MCWERLDGGSLHVIPGRCEASNPESLDSGSRCLPPARNDGPKMSQRVPRVSDTLEGAVALKQQALHDLSPTENAEALQWSKAGVAAQTAPSKAERRTECGERGHFPLGRDSSRMKCDTCGSAAG
jgi:ribonucleoside-diphosphate reductase alpha chain